MKVVSIQNQNIVTGDFGRVATKLILQLLQLHISNETGTAYKDGWLNYSVPFTTNGFDGHLNFKFVEETDDQLIFRYRGTA
ncbi:MULTISPECIES: hypothetical protein [Larkinella]|jgi:hypothetical protein|uniref:Uncharacterized protein n=1 Tax=Larkinella humicola TaxID=2607654 RepID=A0A5N1JRF3_9BACT|nr:MULTISPECIES: hypothetical protein [Larkinella]KAA9356892.1 hypothetical protein F0P93_03890 [Larkinella humicola]